MTRSCQPSAASSEPRSRCSSTITVFPHFHARHAEGEAKVWIDNPDTLYERATWPGSQAAA
jgi:hypothetical protein